MSERIDALRQLTVERCNVQELAGLLRNANAHPGIVADWLTEHSMGRSPVPERDVCLLFARDRLACRGTDWPVLLPAVFRPETFCEWAGRVGRTVAAATIKSENFDDVRYFRVCRVDADPLASVGYWEPRFTDACRTLKLVLLRGFGHLVFGKYEKPCRSCGGAKKVKRQNDPNREVVAEICGACWGSGDVGYTLTAIDLVPPAPWQAPGGVTLMPD